MPHNCHCAPHFKSEGCRYFIQIINSERTICIFRKGTKLLNIHYGDASPCSSHLHQQNSLVTIKMHKVWLQLFQAVDKYYLSDLHCGFYPPGVSTVHTVPVSHWDFPSYQYEFPWQKECRTLHWSSEAKSWLMRNLSNIQNEPSYWLGVTLSNQI